MPYDSDSKNINCTETVTFCALIYQSRALSRGAYPGGCSFWWGVSLFWDHSVSSLFEGWSFGAQSWKRFFAALGRCQSQHLVTEYSGLILVLRNSNFSVYCASRASHHSSNRHISAAPGIKYVLSRRKELILSVVKKKYVASIQGPASVDLHLSELPGRRKMLSFWYGRGREKKQALGLSPLGRSQQIQVASCWLCCFPTSVGLFVHPSPTAAHSCVLHAIAAPVCFFIYLGKKKKVWLSGAYICLCQHPKVVAGHLGAWYICSTDPMEAFLATISLSLCIPRH